MARLAEGAQVVDAHFGDPDVLRRHNEVSGVIAQSDLWAVTLNNRPEVVVLNSCVDELDTGFYNICTGYYLTLPPMSGRG